MTKLNAVQRLDLYRSVIEDLPFLFFRKFIWYVLARWIVSSYIPGTLWRKVVLRLFGAKIGSGGRIKPRVQVTCPWNLIVGNSCWLGEGLWIDNISKVQLGNFVCVSQGVYLCTGNHNYRSKFFDLNSSPILIHDEVWIAAFSIVAPGTVVREAAVIGLGSVISGEIPPKSIVRGNPSKVVGLR